MYAHPGRNSPSVAERQTSARLGLRCIQSLEATILLHFPGRQALFSPASGGYQPGHLNLQGNAYPLWENKGASGETPTYPFARWAPFRVGALDSEQQHLADGELLKPAAIAA